MPLYLTSADTYDRGAILRDAWAMARREVALAARTFGVFKSEITTARAEFAACLRRVWDRARDERCTALWKAEQVAGAPAEAARRAALPAREREIEAAKVALIFAEHNDTVGSHRLVAAAQTRLAAALQRAA